ncbi:OVARIAN TUMOR DOMAIN-containing deubiquitinating enzyme 11 (OTU domain-containing protein 11) (Deubiquitinating enzyme OTU11) [Durusdinium trenchii]|uniref:OVARIAN TUMOR DOMAIN-containing deubiquitinating enzyme 11 (OTU domain-containing protein 11) (Deubiquitinating enzyme OTU11) n=1 Tax=Durusdinium trenchii TaxID=1381693 RepID=A0ABP0RY28_9DINO
MPPSDEGCLMEALLSLHLPQLKQPQPPTGTTRYITSLSVAPPRPGRESAMSVACDVRLHLSELWRHPESRFYTERIVGFERQLERAQREQEEVHLSFQRVHEDLRVSGEEQRQLLTEQEQSLQCRLHAGDQETCTFVAQDEKICDRLQHSLATRLARLADERRLLEAQRRLQGDLRDLGRQATDLMDTMNRSIQAGPTTTIVTTHHMDDFHPPPVVVHSSTHHVDDFHPPPGVVHSATHHVDGYHPPPVVVHSHPHPHDALPLQLPDVVQQVMVPPVSSPQPVVQQIIHHRAPVPQKTVVVSDVLPGLLAEGLREVEVRGDGNCQFRALAHQIYGTEHHHPSVRSAVVQQLRAGHHRYNVGAVQDYFAWVDSMALERSWGDGVTLQAAADKFEVAIWVFQDGLPPGQNYLRIDPHGRTTAILKVVFQPSRNHYNAASATGR